MHHVRITNETDWRTDDLRRVILESLKVAGVAEGSRAKPWQIRVGTCIDIQCDGYAYIGTRELCIRLPPAEWAADGFLPSSIKIDLAQTLLHELDHCRGLEHADMVELDTVNVDWVHYFEVRALKRPRYRKEKR